jgi:uncharacterized protein
MRFAITGSSGLVGTALTRMLRGGGHEVTRVVRSFSGLPHGEKAVVWDPARGVIERAGLEGHDVVIHLAGEGLFGVWTEGKKRRIRESRVRGTTLIAEAVAALDRPPRVLVSASGVHFYGDRGDELLDEGSAPGPGFLAGVVRDWETAADPARAAGIRVVHMRSGVILSGEGGMLAVLRPLFRAGLGAKLGSGSQYWPWIALEDVGPALLHVIERPELSGPVNFVAPQQVTNAEFTDVLAAVVRRPSLFRVPAFATRAMPGGMGDEMVLFSERVVPRKLLDSGYEYRQPELKRALRAMLE